MAGTDEDARRRVVEVPYVRDAHAQRLMEVIARIEALARGEAPLWVTGAPAPDWSRAADDSLRTPWDVSHAVDVLSSAAAREVELSLVCARIIRRVSQIVEEEVDGYIDDDTDL